MPIHSHGQSFGHLLSINGQYDYNIDGLVQDCSISSALAMKLLQSCTKPSVWDILSSLFHFQILGSPTM